MNEFILARLYQPAELSAVSKRTPEAAATTPKLATLQACVQILDHVDPGVPQMPPAVIFVYFCPSLAQITRANAFF